MENVPNGLWSILLIGLTAALTELTNQASAGGLDAYLGGYSEIVIPVLLAVVAVALKAIKEWQSKNDEAVIPAEVLARALSSTQIEAPKTTGLWWRVFLG